MYGLGEGVPEDYVNAYAWLSVAAAQGHIAAKDAKELITEKMTRQQLKEAQKLSREYRSRYVEPFQ